MACVTNPKVLTWCATWTSAEAMPWGQSDQETFDPVVNRPRARGNPRPGRVKPYPHLGRSALWGSWCARLYRLPHRGQVASRGRVLEQQPGLVDHDHARACLQGRGDLSPDRVQCDQHPDRADLIRQLLEGDHAQVSAHPAGGGTVEQGRVRPVYEGLQPVGQLPGRLAEFVSAVGFGRGFLQ